MKNREMRDKVFFFTPIVLLMFATCAATYANIPSRSLLEDVVIAEDHFLFEDKELNTWKVVTDCNLDITKLDKPSVSLNRRNLGESSTVIVKDQDLYKRCKVDNLTLL